MIRSSTPRFHRSATATARPSYALAAPTARVTLRKRPAPSLIHQDLDVVERVLRDQLGSSFKTMWVDSESEYERILRFVERFLPLVRGATGVEVILAPRSTLAGKSLREIDFREKYGLTVVAIWREGRPRRTALVDLPVQLGDALLVQGHRDRIRVLSRDPDFLVLEPEGGAAMRTGRAPWAIGALVLMILLSTAGIEIAVAALAAAALVVAAGCVTAEEIYQFVDWRVIVFIGAMLPISTALTTTGVAAQVVSGVIDTVGRGTLPALIALLGIGIVANQVMPSVAATVLLAPIALQIAAATGSGAHAFMMAVIAATGTTFTPISNPVNLLVMGPGGYKMSDYVRIGLPLALLLAGLSLIVIPLFWPLR